MAYKVLSLKWRPTSFDQVIGQEHITISLSNAIKLDRVAHAFTFAGPRGVGKTTTARILAKELNGIKDLHESFDVIVSCDALYYMEDPGRSISESFRILKQNGLIIIISRNQFYQKFEFIRKLLNIGPTDDLHSRLFYKSELHKILIDKGFINVCSNSFCVIPIKGFSFLVTSPLFPNFENGNAKNFKAISNSLF